MKRKVVTIDEKASLAKTVDVMQKNEVGSVVVTRNRKAVGIITERDIIKLITRHRKTRSAKAKDIMSTPMIAAAPNVEMLEAVEFMVKKKIKKLPIVEGERLVGIVTFTDFATLQPAIAELLQKLGAVEEIPQRFMKYSGTEKRYII